MCRADRRKLRGEVEELVARLLYNSPQPWTEYEWGFRLLVVRACLLAALHTFHGCQRPSQLCGQLIEEKEHD